MAFLSVTATQISNWIAVYAATGICCTFAMAMSVTTITLELVKEKIWLAVSSWRSAALLVPNVWWRWQKRYLMSTPVTLAIVGAFAATLDWTV